MSEQPAAPPSAPARKENVLTHKLGPFPTWAWIAIAAAIVIGYSVIAGRQKPGTAAADTSVPADQVPQFVNQTFTTVTPPAVVISTGDEDKDRIHTATEHAYSWTQRGGPSQRWTLGELAKRLGISIAALHPANAAAKRAVANPRKAIPMGAHFTYLKQPKDITTGTGG